MDFNTSIDLAANEAIFQLQLDTTDAIRFVCRAVKGCTHEQACAAIRAAVIFHR